tara:strand:+ start:289 stop:564 length:276 start_codon:yes stop_codon:yes gene_type:complete
MGLSQSHLTLNTGEAMHEWIANPPRSFITAVNFENVGMVDTDLSATTFKWFDEWNASVAPHIRTEETSSTIRPGILAMLESKIFASLNFTL